MAKSVAKTMAKWESRTTGATEAYKDGIDGVTVAPNSKAAAAVDKYARKTQEAVTSGRFVAANQAVDLGQWQQAAKTKGATNQANGIRNMTAKAKAAQARFLEYAQQVRQQIDSMPNLTEADAEARIRKNLELMRAYKKNNV